MAPAGRQTKLKGMGASWRNMSPEERACGIRG